MAATLGWAVLGIQLYLTSRTALANGKSLIDGLITYLSFFTILTNILVALALSAPFLRPDSAIARFFSRPTVKTGIAASIALVGIGYTVLLRRLWQPEGMQLVADILLHDVMPVLFLLYWWLSVPKGLVRWTDALPWMLYPLFYVMYALVRGALSGVYPYPFIDAGQLGYARVSLNATGLLLGFATVTLLLIGLTRLRKRALPGAPT